MMYQYHCACCNKVLNNTARECSECGSHHIRSPFSMWIFCIMACLVVAITIKLVHVYIQDHQDTPAQFNLFTALDKDKNHSNSN